MNTYSKKQAQSKSIGYFVHFALSDDSLYHVAIKSRNLMQTELNIYLPKNKNKNWLTSVARAIQNVQCGNKWPLRISWENVKQFFTLEQIRCLDLMLGDISVCLYGVPSSQEEKLDALYKAKRAAVLRKKRAAAIDSP